MPPGILQDKKAVPSYVDASTPYNILKQRVQKGYHAPTGNAFDINTLHFHSCIVEIKTAHCFYGDLNDSADMQFALSDSKLTLV